MVYLIGAGPGDIGLLTIKAAECIKNADVIVHDRLSSSSILSLAKEGAEFVYVGKAPGKHHKTQEEINQILVDFGGAGKTVARVKGGDPFVFGRGSEEALELVNHNIPFEVLPGVTSSISAPAYGGIPVTHRGIADSFHVITGHKKDDARDMDFKILAKLSGTLVFLMGVSNLAYITQSLMKNGKNPDTPVALVQQGTTCRQKKAVGTLSSICDAAEEQGIKSPAVIIVGEVVSLHKKLDWFGKKPLHAKRIAVTRAREQASELTKKLLALDADVFEFPLIKIKENEEETKNAVLCDSDVLIFTSKNAVKIYFDGMAKNNKDIRELFDTKIFSVGESTKEYLKTKGILCEDLPQKFTGESLAELVMKNVPTSSRIKIVRSDISAKTVGKILAENGYAIDDFVIYQTVCDARGADEFLRLDAEGEIDYITFTSSSTVHNFIKSTGTTKTRAKAICIGEVTAKTAAENGIAVFAVADHFTIDGLVEKIIEISTI
ncbi:MAG: cysG 2 [Oscillospiraceae bacterium]|nr:cysG 2 [Oscillospiraceae bacterium]